MHARALFSFAAFALASAGAGSAMAAPPFTERRLTLPSHNWSFDVGAAVASESFPNEPFARSRTGGGGNFDFAVAPIEHLELGGRQGFRFNDDARLDGDHADEYARIFDRQTFGALGETYPNFFANPEFRIRGQLVDGDIFELGLEGRFTAPLSRASQPVAVFGLPLAFHAGRKIRIDTGVWTPVAFYDPAFFLLSAPVDVWFQITEKFWLGPQAGFTHVFERHIVRGDGSIDVLTPAETFFNIGFGLGIQVHKAIDLKFRVYDPAINEPGRFAVRHIGAAFGAQFRIE